jgi:hypothetical protein
MLASSCTEGAITLRYLGVIHNVKMTWGKCWKEEAGSLTPHSSAWVMATSQPKFVAELRLTSLNYFCITKLHYHFQNCYELMPSLIRTWIRPGSAAMVHDP